MSAFALILGSLLVFSAAVATVVIEWREWRSRR